MVETLADVIDWHQRELIPDSAVLTSDRRTRLVNGDFFAMAEDAAGFDPETPGRRFHAVLVDIDHTPRHVLSSQHAAFYTPAGLTRLARHLHPDGVFALWSDDPPDPDFEAAMAQVFATSTAQVVTFANHHTGGESSNTVYLGR